MKLDELIKETQNLRSKVEESEVALLKSQQAYKDFVVKHYGIELGSAMNPDDFVKLICRINGFII